MAVELCKFSLVVNWEVELVVKNVTAAVIYQVFEKSRGNSIYMDDGMAWLLLSTTGAPNKG